jgi:hypothetical protein
MDTPDHQGQQSHESYWQAVTDLAQQIVTELQDTDQDQDEVLHRLLHETTDDHDYVVRDDLQIQTLQYSRHPCAALFHGTLLGERYRPNDSFPFAAFAAEAFEMDVAQKVRELLGEV